MIKINNILCPIDLTPDSDEALRYAVALANKYDALLFVMHCIEKPKSPVEEAIEDAKASVLAAVERWTRLGGPVNIRWESVVLIGDPVKEINRVAWENRADLIVMRSLRNPITARLFGSTADSMCHTSPCPILVTHPNEREWAGKFTREIDLQRILVAFDFSPDAELALTFALLLSQEYQTELHVINILKPETKSHDARSFGTENQRYEIEQQLRQAIPDEALLWSRVKYAVLDGEPHSEIISYAEQQEIDLICMGVRGSDIEVGNRFGSNVDHILHESPCPVLVARPAGTVAASL